MYRIEITEFLGHGYQIIPGLYLSNDLEQAKKLITPSFVEAAGGLETRALHNADAFVYSIGEWESQCQEEKEKIRVLGKFLDIVHLFLNTLWFIKDCSVNQEIGFFEYPFRNSYSSVSSNFRGVLFTTAEGSFRKTRFTREELRVAREVIRLFGPREKLNPFIEDTHKDEPYSGVDRFSLCLFFLQAARTMSYVPVKIAFYCTCFESLVSTDPSETAHKVAERVAILLKQKDNPSGIFKSLKKAYGIRSKTVHGSLIKMSDRECVKLSTLCDEYLRDILITFLRNSNLMDILMGRPEKIDDFFLKKVLEERNTS
ncbi:hypothetical protein DRN69_03380 [Candidatus Pacearchaeota archaeon]|nr:MAG: hypothetical protein DRN69_03380 [Candidatus Pacearchaeota archaeon]